MLWWTCGSLGNFLLNFEMALQTLATVADLKQDAVIYPVLFENHGCFIQWLASSDVFQNDPSGSETSLRPSRYVWAYGWHFSDSYIHCSYTSNSHNRRYSPPSAAHPSPPPTHPHHPPYPTHTNPPPYMCHLWYHIVTNFGGKKNWWIRAVGSLAEECWQIEVIGNVMELVKIGKIFGKLL